MTFLAQIQWLFMTILWLFNIFSDPTRTISGTILYLKDRFPVAEETKNTIHTLWPIKTEVTYFSLPDNHFSPFAVFVNLLQIFVFSLSPPKVCSGLVVLAVYFSGCFSLQLPVWYLLEPNQPNHLQHVYSTCTAQFCHQFQLLTSQLLFFSHYPHSFVSSSSLHSLLGVWLSDLLHTKTRKHELSRTIHEWLGTPGRHQHAEVHL